METFTTPPLSPTELQAMLTEAIETGHIPAHVLAYQEVMRSREIDLGFLVRNIPTSYATVQKMLWGETGPVTLGKYRDMSRHMRAALDWWPERHHSINKKISKLQEEIAALERQKLELDQGDPEKLARLQKRKCAWGLGDSNP